MLPLNIAQLVLDANLDITAGSATGEFDFGFAPGSNVRLQSELADACIRCRDLNQPGTAEFTTGGKDFQAEIQPLQNGNATPYLLVTVTSKQAHKQTSVVDKLTFCAFELDPVTEEFIGANERFAGLLGYTPEELIGRRFPSLARSGEDMDLDAVFAAVRSGSLTKYDDILPYIHKDLTIKEMQTAFSVWEEDGRTSILCFAVDISEFRQAEKRFELAQEASMIGIWEWDIASGKLEWDDTTKRLHGIAADRSIDAYEVWEKAVHRDDLVRVRQSIEQALAGEKDYDENIRINWPNGEEHTLKAYAYVSRNEEGQPTKMTGATYEITDMLKHEARLRELNQRLLDTNTKLKSQNTDLEQFAHIVSHDLQGPMNNITSFADLIKETKPGTLDKDTGRYLDIITDSVGRLRKLMNDVLDFSRIRADADTFQMVACQNIVDEILSDFSLSLKKIDAKVTIGRLPAVKANPAQLRLVFQNLISNALKYYSKDRQPELTIAVSQTPPFWRFVVEDNGIGIAAKYYEKIFRVFQRLHTNEEYEGDGLGLAHCRKFVELHGGKIWVESILDKGTTFYFTMPM